MDISFECSVSLSKKMRAVIGESDARFVLVADKLVDGKGYATLMISSDNLNFQAAKERVGEETNVQFTPISLKDEVPSSSVVTNLFSTAKANLGVRDVIDRMAVTKAPDKKEVSHAVKRENEIEIPDNFHEYKEQKFLDFVSDLEGLTRAIKSAQGKTSDIDLDAIKDPRKRAIAAEMKDMQEAIDLPAFIVNDKYASLRINDLGLSLALNAPVNLANLSAKRISSSGELRSLIKSNMVKFINPSEVESYRLKAIHGQEDPGLEVFSNRGDAKMAIESETRIPESEQVDINMNDIDAPSEQEQLSGLINLTSINDSGSRITHHGNSEFKQKKAIPTSASVNKQGISTIKKKSN